VSFCDRQSQQRQPRNERQGDHTTRHQFRDIAARMRIPQELKEISEKSGSSGESGSVGSVFMSLDVYRFQSSAWARLLKADCLPTSRALLFARKNQSSRYSSNSDRLC